MLEKIKQLLEKNEISYEIEIERYYTNPNDYDNIEEYPLGIIVGDYVYINLINNIIIINTDDYKDVEIICKHFKEANKVNTFSNEFYRIELPLNKFNLEKQVNFLKRYI